MTMKEFQKIQKEKEKAAERIIKKMKVMYTNNILIAGEIGAYTNYGNGITSLTASLRAIPEKYIFSDEIISEYNRTDLKQFVLFLLTRNKEEEILLVFWKEKKNDWNIWMQEKAILQSIK